MQNEYQPDFAGKNGFIWFTGIVEGRQEDPLKMGRIKVRIFGWHSEDRVKCPTDDLPWAQILLPVNGNKSFSLPREAEWVFGFFLDGESGQMPVVMGVYNGLVSNTTMNILNTGSNNTNTSSLKSAVSGEQRTQNTVANAFDNIPRPPRLPKFPSDQIEEAIGLPTISKLSREVIEGTAIAITNNVRSVFCSSEGPIGKAITFAKSGIRVLAVAIRKGLQIILKALGFSPAAGGIVETIKSITRFIKDLTEFITDVRNWVQKLQQFIKKIILYIRELIRLIETLKKLPALLLAQIKVCLAKAYQEVKRAVLAILNEEIGGPGNTLNELIAAARNFQNEAAGLVNDFNSFSDTMEQFSKINLFGDFSSSVLSANTSINSSISNNQTLMESSNVALAQTFLDLDENGNPRVDLENMTPREREEIVYSIYPCSRRFSFSSVRLA